MFFLEVCGEEMKAIIRLVKIALNIIWIAVPILLILLGSLDLAKAVATNDDKQMKEATGKLAKRAGYAVGVFFVVLAVKLIMNTISSNVVTTEDGAGERPNSFIECWNNAGQVNSEE